MENEPPPFRRMISVKIWRFSKIEAFFKKKRAVLKKTDFFGKTHSKKIQTHLFVINLSSSIQLSIKVNKFCFNFVLSAPYNKNPTELGICGIDFGEYCQN